MNTQLAVKSNVLFLYGGILEQGDRSYTLNDLWALDLKKMDKWKQIVETEQMDWAGSDKGTFFDTVCEVLLRSLVRPFGVHFTPNLL